MDTTATNPSRDPKRTALIRTLKRTLCALTAKFKEDRRQGRGKDSRERFAWRCHHVVYCLLRGKTLEQIENHRLNGVENNVIEQQFQSTIKAMLDAIEAGDYDLDKLYVVLTSSNLKPSEQAVQMGHGVGAFMTTFPGVWKNTTLVYLELQPRDYCWKASNQANSHACWVSSWCEPDMKFTFTSMAAFGLLAQRAFKDFQLLGAEQQKKLFGMIG